MGKFRRANSKGKGLSHPAVKVLIVMNILLLGTGLYIYYNNRQDKTEEVAFTDEQPDLHPGDSVDVSTDFNDVSGSVSTGKPQEVPLETVKALKKNQSNSPTKKAETRPIDRATPDNKLASSKNSSGIRKEELPSLVIQANNRQKTRYTVAKGQVHFHNEPDPATRRKAFINHWNKAVLEPLDERNGFIYIVYTNHLGQTSKGWLPVSELKRLPDK